VTIGPDATVHDLVLLLQAKDLGGVPVVEGDGRLVGIVTEGDLVIEDADVRLPHYFGLFGNLVYLGGQKKFEERLNKMVGNAVRDVMTTEVVTVTADEPVRAAANIMVDKKVNRVPVVDDKDRLIGIVARHDIIRMMGCRCSTTASARWRPSTSRRCATTSPTWSPCCRPARRCARWSRPTLRSRRRAGRPGGAAGRSMWLGVATVAEVEELREAAITRRS